MDSSFATRFSVLGGATLRLRLILVGFNKQKLSGRSVFTNFLPVYNYAWTIEKFSRIAASYKPGKTMYSDQFVVMVNGRETRSQQY